MQTLWSAKPIVKMSWNSSPASLIGKSFVAGFWKKSIIKQKTQPATANTSCKKGLPHVFIQLTALSEKAGIRAFMVTRGNWGQGGRSTAQYVEKKTQGENSYTKTPRRKLWVTFTLESQFWAKALAALQGKWGQRNKSLKSPSMHRDPEIPTD